ncbi:MAG: 6-pyruvoyl-tetrahydropterin synthase-related protein [Candidatus Alcyoniella australis]|nr:6-pyruvoyl-tetrahydropterin synthase-related protein [Candidatus Alcyoniella australis]
MQPAGRLQALLAWALTTLVALWAARGFFTVYSVYGHSADLDVVRVLEYGLALAQGDLYPRWVEHTYHCFGSPLFHFYAPLAYFPAGLAMAAGLPLWAAIKLPFVLAFLLAGWGAFALGSRLGSCWAGLACAATLCFAPYFLIDAYVRASLAEMWGIALAPWALWAVLRVREAGGVLPPIVLALVIAAIALTHNITIMLLLPIVIIACLLWCGPRRLNALAGVGLGLLLSAFFWLPALLERGLVYARENLTQGHFHFSNHFLQLKLLIAPEWSQWPPRTVEADAFELGLAQAGLLVLAPLCALALGRGLRQAGLLLAVCLGSLLMVDGLSEPLWSSLPLLPYVQFPWRFLGLFCWAIAALAAWPALWIEDRLGALGAAAWAVGWSVMLIAVQGDGVAPQYLALDQQTAQEIVAEDREQHEANLEAGGVDVARFWSAEQMVWFKARGTSWDDFLPRGVAQNVCLFCEDYIDPAMIDAGSGTILHSARGNSWVEALVRVETEATLRLHVFDFRGWQVTLDGRPSEHRPYPEVGDISLRLEPGEHLVRASFKGSGLTRLCNVISIAALLAIIGMFLYGMFRGKRTDPR